MGPCELNKILLFGGGFGAGVLFSIIILDWIYKGIMSRTIDEIHKQYKRALKLMEAKFKRDDSGV